MQPGLTYSLVTTMPKYQTHSHSYSGNIFFPINSACNTALRRMKPMVTIILFHAQFGLISVSVCLYMVRHIKPHTNTRTYTRTHISHTQTYERIHKRASMHTHTVVHSHVYTHTVVHTRTHTRTHARTHAHT